MARALTLGNGKLLVCLDEHGFVRDFYYPYVGLENHVAGHKHRIGFQVNGKFSWIDDGTWDINIGYKPGTMVGYLVCKNDQLGATVVMEDIVYNETNIFLRQIDIYNQTDSHMEVKAFFHQVFHISETKKRNTAFYDPTHNAVVHYKGKRVFIVNGRTADGSSIDDYTVGAYQFEGKEGSFRDAEDGELTKNAVEHGSVDSVIRFSTSAESKQKSRIYYWICAGKSLKGGYELNDLVLKKTPSAMIHSTSSYWHAWLNTQNLNLEEYLSPELVKLFNTSLFILRCHTDNGGSIIASADSEMIEYGKDDYSYMWPRDAAFITNALLEAGFAEVSKPFFLFCKDILHEDGYLHHRFRPDKSLGSTWHSATSQQQWLKDGILQLPIQEDETASVLFSLWKYYKQAKDLEFIEFLYKPLIEKMAQFLVDFRHKPTGLPLPSYDLWEEKIGVSTYTCAAVYGGLKAAAQFSELLHKRNHMREYNQAADEIREATMEHLFSKELDAFVRIATYGDNGSVVRDETVDSSSLFGLWYFGMLDQEHPLFIRTQHQLASRLKNSGPVGGYIRYEDDKYFRDTKLPNPWFITTMWEVERLLRKSEVTIQDLDLVEQTLNWVLKYQYLSGVLAEQLNPFTGESRSATPLVWSHGVFVETVLWYVRKKRELTAKGDADILVHEL